MNDQVFFSGWEESGFCQKLIIIAVRFFNSWLKSTGQQFQFYCHEFFAEGISYFRGNIFVAWYLWLSICNTGDYNCFRLLDPHTRRHQYVQLSFSESFNQTETFWVGYL